MSMGYAPIYGEGLMMTSEEFEVFVEGYKKTLSPKEAEIFENKVEAGEIDGYPFKWCRKSDKIFFVNVLDEVGFEAVAMFRISDDEIVDYPDVAYLVWSSKKVGLISYWAKETYSSKEELIKEFKDKMERYLPDDFDWENHIGEVSMCHFR